MTNQVSTASVVIYPYDYFVEGTNYNDTLYGMVGHNYVDGNGGYDLLSYAAFNQPIAFDGIATVGKGLAGVDHVTEVEAIYAPSGFYNLIDASYTGTATALYANLSTNFTQVAFANGAVSNFNVYNFVAVFGTSQNDTIIGSVESNFLAGGAGNDYIRGGQGFDTLVGGTGSDVFALGDAYGLDALGASFATIADWNPYEDYIQVDGSASGFYSFGVSNFSGGLALDTLVYYNNDLLAVVQDSTNVNFSNFLFA
ncbi:MAG: hypothetical protein NW224_20880 [Leptolyngbyaceae cyanobacterium bins.302]|nr:hypothetical protein [Leptolyngbyaceae cyanobacterium bins.302]